MTPFSGCRQQQSVSFSYDIHNLCICAAGIDPYDPTATAASEIVCFSASFHGRTMGALALTYKEQYKTPFNPVMPGAKLATYQDLDSAAKLVKKVRLI